MPYSLKLLLIGLVSLPAGIVILFLSPFDREGKLAYRIAQIWTWAVLRIGGIRLKVHGVERLDPNRQYIFVANHQSYIDIPALVQALTQFQLCWMAKKELLWVPLFGWVLWSSKHIIVDRSNLSTAMASLRKARDKIQGGISVGIFPEGTRSPDGRLLPFKRGGFVLAVKVQAPIVPVTIKGSGAILPRGDWRIRRGEIEVIVSEPIAVNQYHLGNLKHLLRLVRDKIESHSRRHADNRSAGSNCVRALVHAEALLGRLRYPWIHCE
ncbi:MAG: lysophospholipid acyltransferase family protein [Candidatus Binatia bacterium]